MDVQDRTPTSLIVAIPARAPLPKRNPPTPESPANGAGPSFPQPALSPPSGASNKAPVVSEHDCVKSSFWLTHSDQFVLAFLAAVMLALLCAYWVRLTKWGTVPVEIEHLNPRQPNFRLDVNSATWVEWGQLDGVGDALAHRIVADREQNGPFRSIDELRRVKGIGPKTLERLRPWLAVESDPPRIENKSASHRARPGS